MNNNLLAIKMKKILSIFSYIFHPLFIPIMATLFYFYFGTNYFLFREIYIVIIQTFIVTVIIPLLFFWLLYILKKADSLTAVEINQRKIPLAAQILFLFYLITKIIRIEYFPELYFCFLASATSVFLAFVMLFTKIKASLHMLGISSFLTFVILLSIHTQKNFIPFIAILVFVCGAVASSRLVMKAHTPKELAIGSVIGIIPQLAFSLLWL